MEISDVACSSMFESLNLHNTVFYHSYLQLSIARL
jgi:hypothetical protein